MSRYATQEAIEGLLQRQLTDAESVNIGLYIEAASDEIEALTGRSWGGDTGTKIYSGLGTDTLFIDPTTDITKVEHLSSDGSVLTELDLSYINYAPFNKDAKTRIISRGTWFHSGNGNYRVTGTPNATIPPAITLACAMLVANALNNPNNVKAESIEGYSVTFDNSDKDEAVMDKLMPFMKPLL